jgi:nucleoside-diphosphate-sugar epimerase
MHVGHSLKGDIRREHKVLDAHRVFNMACGEQTSLLEMVEYLQEMTAQPELKPHFGPERKGDVRYSLASIDAIRSFLDYRLSSFFKHGLEVVLEWYSQSRNPIQCVTCDQFRIANKQSHIKGRNWFVR